MSKSFHSVICMYEEKQNQDFTYPQEDRDYV